MEHFSFSAECAVCCEAFAAEGEHAPHLLACGHTLCLGCIRRISRGGRDVVCPTCRELTRIPQGRAAPPKNFQLVELLATLAASSSAAAAAASAEPSAPDVSLMMPPAPAPATAPALAAAPVPHDSSSSMAPVPVAPMMDTGGDFDRFDPPPKEVPDDDAAASARRSRPAPDEQIAFAEFAVPRENPFFLVHDWLRGLWFAPSDLRARAVVPRELRATLVPHWVFSATVRAKVAAVEEVPGSDGRASRRPFTWQTSINERQICACAAASAVHRSFIDAQFRGSWDLSRLRMHDPAASSSGKRSSTSGEPAAEAAAVAEPSLGGFIGWFFRALVPGKMAGKPQFAPLPDAEIVDHATAEEVWQGVYRELTLELQNSCRRAVQDATRKGKRIVGSRTEVGPASFEARLVYLPLYVGEYTYNEQCFRVMCNGQTGDVRGDRPWLALWSETKRFFSSIFESKKKKGPSSS